MAPLSMNDEPTPAAGRDQGAHPSGKRNARLNRIAVFAATAVVAALLALSLLRGRSAAEELPIYWPVPPFALVDQSGDTLRREELRGKVWVASFVFTNCTSICPLITQKMAEVRDTLRDRGVLGEEVRLVSFSVDPGRDTPDALREYAAKFGGSPPHEWAFLTGSPPDSVRRMIEEGFKLSATLPPEHEHAGGNYQVMHSPRIVLVDRDGQVRGLYDSREPEALRALSRGVEALLD